MGGWTFKDDTEQTISALRRGFAAAAAATAQTAKADAQSHCPVDTGQLRDSARVITSTQSGPEEEGFEFQLPDYGPDVAHVQVAFLAPYASLVHNGYISHVTGRYVAGRPFLSDALHLNSEELLQRAANVLRAHGAKSTSWVR
jgi:hypothetical protein